VPRGFDKYPSNISQAMRERYNVDTMIYTDGFAAFSVFVQAMPDRREVNFERQNGATIVITRTLQGPMGKNQLVTVVGEVPAKTAKKIASDMVYLR
jgi:sigma-E factor negative regulatory protein RseB